MKLDSWEWDHSCNIENVIANGKCLEEVDTFEIDGIQGILIAEYSEKRRPNKGMLPKCFLWGSVQGHHYGTISWIFGEPEKVNAQW